MTGSRVLALGHYQPSSVLTNDDLAKMVDTDDAWIRSRVGIRTRHVAAPDETVDAMAAAAAAKALADSGLAPQDIDLVLVATCTAIDRSPNIAARVAARLGPGRARHDGPQRRLRRLHPCAGHRRPRHPRRFRDPRAGHRGGEVHRGRRLDRPLDLRAGRRRRGRRRGRAPPTEPGIGPVLWGSVPQMGGAVRIEGDPARFAQEGQTVYRWATTQLPAIARKVCERAGIAPGRPRRRRAAPGQPADHRTGRRAARRGQRGGRPRRRRLRQHLGGLRSARPVQAGRAAARSPPAPRCCCSPSAATSRTRARSSAAREAGRGPCPIRSRPRPGGLPTLPA